MGAAGGVLLTAATGGNLMNWLKIWMELGAHGAGMCS